MVTFNYRSKCRSLCRKQFVDVRGNTSVLLDKDLPRKILPGWREVRHEIGTLTLTGLLGLSL